MEENVVWSMYSTYLRKDLYFVEYPDGLISYLDCPKKLDHRFYMNKYDTKVIMQVGCPLCNKGKRTTETRFKLNN